MNHHGGMNAIKASALKHQNFSTGVADFLGGRANHADGETYLIGDFRGGKSGANSRSRNDVVPASVADPGQGVVFGANADVQRARPSRSAKRRRQIADSFQDAEARV
jgi:hypothetical protein